MLSKERETREPSARSIPQKKFDLNYSASQATAGLTNGRFKASDSEPQTPVLYSLEQLPTLEEENKPAISAQLALNMSKVNDASQRENLRFIQQLEYKLEKQREVNRDLRVEKDMYMLKLEEAEKRVAGSMMA